LIVVVEVVVGIVYLTFSPIVGEVSATYSALYAVLAWRMTVAAEFDCGAVVACWLVLVVWRYARAARDLADVAWVLTVTLVRVHVFVGKVWGQRLTGPAALFLRQRGPIVVSGTFASKLIVFFDTVVAWLAGAGETFDVLPARYAGVVCACLLLLCSSLAIVPVSFAMGTSRP
jgi:hypothetical protein